MDEFCEDKAARNKDMCEPVFASSASAPRQAPGKASVLELSGKLDPHETTIMTKLVNARLRRHEKNVSSIDSPEITMTVLELE